MGLRMDNVALTESQQERFANLRADTMEKAAPVIVRVQSIERQYRTALMQPSVNREQLARLQSQLAAQKQTLDAIYGNSMAVSAQLLTREQRQTMRQRMVREQDRSGANRPAAASERPSCEPTPVKAQMLVSTQSAGITGCGALLLDQLGLFAPR